eukprot:m.224416 g.224416  ORF g.224416 m.224416 type:complete len:239 (+) comp25877_c1_seq1:444-1160(+)
MTELRHVMATATTTATAATAAAAANPVVPPRDHEHDDDTGTPTHRTVSYRVALPHPPTPRHEAGRAGDAAACRGCPTYVPSDEPHANFLPPPDDRLVAELSSAELHEVRKDSERMTARYDHLLQVLQDAKINEEYTFPSGTRRVVQTMDVLNAAHEVQRLLKLESNPCGLSFLSPSPRRPLTRSRPLRLRSLRISLPSLDASGLRRRALERSSKGCLVRSALARHCSSSAHREAVAVP